MLQNAELGRPTSVYRSVPDDPTSEFVSLKHLLHIGKQHIEDKKENDLNRTGNHEKAVLTKR
ncbi:hypothetical protein GCM10023192_44110 [Amycolatopsis samaneae]